jgi:LacI family transcriptional regulator
MSERLAVAILVATSNTYGRGVLDGIIAYQRKRDVWSIHFGELGNGGRPPEWFKNWKGDGVIAGIAIEALAASLQRRSLPTVDVCATHRVRRIPPVSTDDFTSARLAVQHLVDRGFRTLAFCGGAQSAQFERRDSNWVEARVPYF